MNDLSGLLYKESLIRVGIEYDLNKRDSGRKEARIRAMECLKA